MNDSSEEETTLKYSELRQKITFQTFNQGKLLFTTVAQIFNEECSNQIIFEQQLIKLQEQQPGLVIKPEIISFDLQYIEQDSKGSMQRVLGKGGYGKVHATQNLNTGRFSVTKMVNFTYSTFLETLQEFIIQSRLYKIESKYFLKVFLPIQIDNNCTFMVGEIEKAEYSLKSYLQTGKKITYAEYQTIADQLINGLLVMHQNKFAHRDIKPENILFVTGIGWKYSDFGISIQYKNNVDYYNIIGTNAYLPKYIRTQLEAFICHTTIDLFYCDKYALSLTLAQILFPQKNFKQIVNVVENDSQSDKYLSILKNDSIEQIKEQLSTIVTKKQLYYLQNDIINSVKSTRQIMQLDNIIQILQFEKVNKKDNQATLILQQILDEESLSEEDRYSLLINLMHLHLISPEFYLKQLDENSPEVQAQLYFAFFLQSLKHRFPSLEIQDILEGESYEEIKNLIQDYSNSELQKQKEILQLPLQQLLDNHFSLLQLFTTTLMLNENQFELINDYNVNFNELLEKIKVQFEKIHHEQIMFQMFTNQKQLPLLTGIQGIHKWNIVCRRHIQQKIIDMGQFFINKDFFNLEFFKQNIIFSFLKPYLFQKQEYQKIIYFNMKQLPLADEVQQVDIISQIMFCYLQLGNVNYSLSLITQQFLDLIFQLNNTNLYQFTYFFTQFFKKLYQIDYQKVDKTLCSIQNMCRGYQTQNGFEINSYFLLLQISYNFNINDILQNIQLFFHKFKTFRVIFSDQGLNIMTQLFLAYSQISKNNIKHQYYMGKSLQILSFRDINFINMEQLENCLITNILKFGFEDNTVKLFFLRYTYLIYFNQDKNLNKANYIQQNEMIKTLKRLTKLHNIDQYLSQVIKVLCQFYPLLTFHKIIRSFSLQLYNQYVYMEQWNSHYFQVSLSQIIKLLQNYNLLDNQTKLILYIICLFSYSQIKMNKEQQNQFPQYFFFKQIYLLLLKQYQNNKNQEQKILIQQFDIFFSLEQFFQQGGYMDSKCVKQRIQQRQMKIKSFCNQKRFIKDVISYSFRFHQNQQLSFLAFFALENIIKKLQNDLLNDIIIK